MELEKPLYDAEEEGAGEAIGSSSAGKPSICA
jgi:hypothetical protein